MTTNTSSKPTLAEKVREYIGRVAKNHDRIPSFPLEKEDTYVVIGGSPEAGERDELGIFTGRYIDVVAKALTLPGFYGWYCGSDNPGNPNNGFVKKYVPPEIRAVPRNDKLLSYIAAAEKLEIKKRELDKELGELESLGGSA